MDPSNDDMWERPLRWSQLSAGARIGLLTGGVVFIVVVGAMVVRLAMTGG